MRAIGPITIAVVTGLLLGGCDTLGGGRQQWQNAVFDTNQRVRNLDKNLGASVAKLNETAADLSARVDAGDQNMRRLQSVAEENQVKLDQLQNRLDQLTATIYRQFNLSQPGGLGETAAPMAPMGEGVGEPIVLPPVEEPSPGQPTEAPPAGVAQPTPAPTSQDALGTEAGAPSPVTDYNRAQRSFVERNYDVALQQFSEYLQRYPDTSDSDNAQFWKAECYFRLEKYEEAIAEFTALRTRYTKSPKAPLAMHNQAAAHLRLGQIEDAKKLLQELVDQYPMEPAAVRAKEKLKQLQGN
jgi:tol-pal system protein YbgF